MDKTANYNLPKWEKTDRVLMDDFNDMTDKLDKALDKAMTRDVVWKLKTFTAEESSQDITLDVSDIDWSQWQYVILDYDLKGGGAHLYVDNRSINCRYYCIGSLNGAQNGSLASLKFNGTGSVVFTVHRNPAREINTVFLSSQNAGYGYADALSYETVRQFHVTGTADYPLDVGTRLTFWGIR